MYPRYSSETSKSCLIIPVQRWIPLLVGLWGVVTVLTSLVNAVHIYTLQPYLIAFQSRSTTSMVWLPSVFSWACVRAACSPELYLSISYSVASTLILHAVDPLFKHYIQASRATIKVQHLPISNLSIIVTVSKTIPRVGIFYASGMLPLTIFRIVLIIIQHRSLVLSEVSQIPNFVE